MLQRKKMKRRRQIDLNTGHGSLRHEIFIIARTFCGPRSVFPVRVAFIAENVAEYFYL